MILHQAIGEYVNAGLSAEPLQDRQKVKPILPILKQDLFSDPPDDQVKITGFAELSCLTGHDASLHSCCTRVYAAKEKVSIRTVPIDTRSELLSGTK